MSASIEGNAPGFHILIEFQTTSAVQLGLVQSVRHLELRLDATLLVEQQLQLDPTLLVVQSIFLCSVSFFPNCFMRLSRMTLFLKGLMLAKSLAVLLFATGLPESLAKSAIRPIWFKIWSSNSLFATRWTKRVRSMTGFRSKR
jgi:hypothetical protein